MAGQASANGAKPRRRPNREADVIDAAIEVFYQRGYAAATIQDVADKVGVLKGSLYYYIDSKGICSTGSSQSPMNSRPCCWPRPRRLMRRRSTAYAAISAHTCSGT